MSDAGVEGRKLHAIRPSQVFNPNLKCSRYLKNYFVQPSPSCFCPVVRSGAPVCSCAQWVNLTGRLLKRALVAPERRTVALRTLGCLVSPWCGCGLQCA